jgi:hypothetical protein
MFVPGVNGSIIANSNAPSGSRLKGAYKNSKKRKMPNGGLTYTPYSRSQNQYTDTPSPKPAIKPKVGDIISPNYERLYTDLGVDLGSYIPGPVGKGFNAISMMRAAGNDNYNQGLDLVPGKKANTLSVVNDIYNIANAKPYKYPGRKMPNGGSVSVDNVSPDGSVDYSYSPSFKSLRGKLQGSTNILSGKQNYITPSVGASYRNFNVDYTPGNVRASIMGNRLNVDAEANFDKSKLVNSVVSGNYQVNPNLSVYGNVNYTPKEPINYGVGFRYSKSFSEGGERDHDDDKEMVDGVASILRRVKDKKNRLQLANQLAKQFNREKVKYSLPSFLAKSKVKK